MLKRAKLFVEICKLAQVYEIKELMKHAEIVRKDMGDIFNEHCSLTAFINKKLNTTPYTLLFLGPYGV